MISPKLNRMEVRATVATHRTFLNVFYKDGSPKCEAVHLDFDECLEEIEDWILGHAWEGHVYVYTLIRSSAELTEKDLSDRVGPWRLERDADWAAELRHERGLMDLRQGR